MANNASTNERKGFDDWEVIKIILDQNPSLKSRVLQKLREMKKEINLKRSAEVKKNTREKEKKG
ncbi:MAG: hypothetical protein HYW48_08705 [Deltaproteobacteria bacterium]|nr:hypothetical protein [Deltaproteobacteria bacterium]